MPPPAVSIESVGKRYRLGTGVDRGSIGQALEKRIKGFLPGRDADRDGGVESREIWAVRDVSFELEAGEALGIVGPNGAGKSTLLKLMSQITLPTEGRIVLNGKVSTLIEVGTGFHPDLTGRENVFLNGAILGMRRVEIANRYGEIVEFAGIERFMETPVKRYSSGMYARLAFAVAAHLDPEILIVDEVLSVGDAEFQRKCIGKMQTVTGEGRTVIFVSHSLGAVQRLCSRAILLRSGTVEMDGDPEHVIGHYAGLSGPQSMGPRSTIDHDAERWNTGEAFLRSVAMSELTGKETRVFRLGQPFRLSATFEVLEDLEDVAFELAISNVEGEQVVTAQSIDSGSPVNLPKGMQEIEVELDLDLLPHEYMAEIAIHRMNGDTVDWVYRAHRFEVLREADDGAAAYPWSAVRGYVRPPSVWSEVRSASDPSTVAQVQ